jgi:predicted permease
MGTNHRDHRALPDAGGEALVSSLRAWRLRFTGLFDKERKDRELAEELETHLQLHIEDNLRLGMTPAEARRNALIKLGGVEQTKENYRDRRGIPIIESLLQDLRFGARMLCKNPGFTAVAVLTLALGIGANTAIFSVINGLLLHPVGVPDANRLVVIQEKYDKLNLKSIPLSPPNFADVRDSREVFASAAALQEVNFNYTSGGNPERLLGAQVSWQWFDVFGVKPLIGRVFRLEEDQPAANHVAVLTYGAWQRLFGEDAAIVGKTIELDKQPYQVVGVMGPDFAWPNQAQLWVPLGLPQAEFAADNRFNENLFVVARIRPEVPLARAETFVQLLGRRIIESDPPNIPVSAGWGLFALPLTEFVFGDLRTPMLVLLGAVGFVLLIACMNIAGLMLARASARAREFAVRTAMGSTRWRLIRQTLTESLLLAGTGTLLGLLFARGGIGLLLRLAPQDRVQGLAIRADAYVVCFTAVVGTLSGVLFGIAPAWQIATDETYGLLKEGGHSGMASRDRLRLRSLLVVSEVALALVLLVGAGLFLKSFARLQEVDPGFDARGVMTVALSLPDTQYSEPQKRIAFYQAVLDRLAHMPGIVSAADTYPLPFTGEEEAGSFDIENRTLGPGDPGPHSDREWVSPEFFSSMNIPLREGRYFTDQDREGTQPVAIIDENLARQYWPGENPVGKRLRHHYTGAPWATIVGVVGHVYSSALVGDAGKGVCYYATFQQALVPFSFLVAKTNSNPMSLAVAIREAVHAVDPAEPVYDVKTMDQRVAASLGPHRLVVSLLGFFSVIALLMAALGLYGVINYSVAQRTQEMSIRVALGAQRTQVLGLVIGHGLRLACFGILLGLLGALALARLVSNQLFQTSTFDPLTLAITALVLLVIALLACYIPARRATRVDPMVALRHE